MQTFDIPDIRARLRAESLSYELRADILALLGLVEETRLNTTRHYHAIEEIADELAEDDQPAWANTLLDAARNLYEDLYPRSSHESGLGAVRTAILRDRGGEAPVAVVGYA